MHARTGAFGSLFALLRARGLRSSRCRRCCSASLANDWSARQLAGGLAPTAQQIAADALVFLVPAAVAHLFAALAASALAAHDSYAHRGRRVRAGSVLGLALILWRIDENGIVACAWGTFLNGVVALAVPLVALAVRADGGDATRCSRSARLGELARAAALPIALQAFFVICLRFASGLGDGRRHELHLCLLRRGCARLGDGVVARDRVSSVPLARAALSPARASRHVVSMSLVSFAAVAAAAGVFALVGDRIVHAALGPAYEGDGG